MSQMLSLLEQLQSIHQPVRPRQQRKPQALLDFIGRADVFLQELNSPRGSGSRLLSEIQMSEFHKSVSAHFREVESVADVKWKEDLEVIRMLRSSGFKMPQGDHHPYSRMVLQTLYFLLRLSRLSSVFDSVFLRHLAIPACVIPALATVDPKAPEAASLSELLRQGHIVSVTCAIPPTSFVLERIQQCVVGEPEYSVELTSDERLQGSRIMQYRAAVRAKIDAAMKPPSRDSDEWDSMTAPRSSTRPPDPGLLGSEVTPGDVARAEWKNLGIPCHLVRCGSFCPALRFSGSVIMKLARNGLSLYFFTYAPKVTWADLSVAEKKEALLGEVPETKLVRRMVDEGLAFCASEIFHVHFPHLSIFAGSMKKCDFHFRNLQKNGPLAVYSFDYEECPKFEHRRFACTDKRKNVFRERGDFSPNNQFSTHGRVTVVFDGDLAIPFLSFLSYSQPFESFYKKFLHAVLVHDVEDSEFVPTKKGESPNALPAVKPEMLAMLHRRGVISKQEAASDKPLRRFKKAQAYCFYDACHRLPVASVEKQLDFSFSDLRGQRGLEDDEWDLVPLEGTILFDLLKRGYPHPCHSWCRKGLVDEDYVCHCPECHVCQNVGGIQHCMSCNQCVPASPFDPLCSVCGEVRFDELKELEKKRKRKMGKVVEEKKKLIQADCGPWMDADMKVTLDETGYDSDHDDIRMPRPSHVVPSEESAVSGRDAIDFAARPVATPPAPKKKKKRQPLCSNGCGRPATNSCGRCKVALYCGRKCQIEHWRRGHRAVCKQKT